MYIKILDGRFAGQVRDIANEAAMALLASGRAERAFQDPPRVVGVDLARGSDVASVAVVSAPAVKTSKKKKAAR